MTIKEFTMNIEEISNATNGINYVYHHNKMKVKFLKSSLSLLQSLAIEPAAHFDPGSEGHDIYGRTGHALGRVCVSLNPQTVLETLKIEEEEEGSVSDGGVMEILRRCKVLLVKYLTRRDGGE